MLATRNFFRRLENSFKKLASAFASLVGSTWSLCVYVYINNAFINLMHSWILSHRDSNLRSFAPVHCATTLLSGSFIAFISIQFLSRGLCMYAEWCYDYWSKSKMSNDKMSNKKMTNDKVSNNKMSSNKMSNDKMSNDKMSNYKMSNHKMLNFWFRLENVESFPCLSWPDLARANQTWPKLI
jgi:pentapeptide MXKDX repeat protein